MTREEAVNELNDRIKSAEYVDSDYIDCVSVNAVKMVISALNVPETNVGDTISRQAAIDAVCKECNKQFSDEPCEPCDCGIMNAVKTLPPAQRKGKWIELSTGIHMTFCRCSECGRYVIGTKGYDVAEEYPYCHCGAKMEMG